MTEQVILPSKSGLNVHSGPLEMARAAHRKYMVKQQAEDLENAIEYYVEAIKSSPSVAEPYYRLASLMYEKGDMSLEIAIEQCKTATDLEPDNINAHIYAGYFLSLANDFTAAKEEFAKAIKTGILNSARPRLFLSKLIQHELDTEGVSAGKLFKYLYYLLSGSFLLICDKSVHNMVVETLSDSLSVFSYRTIGETLEKAKLYTIAYNAYAEGMLKTEHGDVFYKKMGDLSMSQQDLLSSYECYKKALKVSPYDRELLLKLATIVQAKFPEKINEAIDYYNKLLEFNIDNDKIYYELGHLYLRKEDKLNSISAFKLALNQNENNPYFNNSLAYAFVQAELYDDAITYYQKAIKINPDAKWTSIVCHALGAVYGEIKGNLDAAEATYQAGLVLDAENYELILSLGDLYMVKGNLEKAIRTYCDGITLRPDHFLAYAKSGLALWEKDYLEESLISFHKSIELNPNFDISQNNLGVVYLDGMGTPYEALGYFMEAIRLNPNYTLAYFNAGRAYQALNNKTKSAEYYQLALDLNKITHELPEDDIKTRLHDLFN